MTFQLAGDMGKFIEERVKAGEYASAQEVVCAGLRMLKLLATEATADVFQPGEWDRLLTEAEGTDLLTLDEVIARRRAERAIAKAAR